METQYTIAEIGEYAKKLGSLYSDKAECTILIRGSKSTAEATAMIYPQGSLKGNSRHLYGKTWGDLADKVSADCDLWVVSHREMTAEDLGIAA